MTTGSAAFTTTHRVVDRVHHDTPVVGTAAQPAAATGLSEGLEVVVRVGNGTDGGAAGHEDHPGLARRQTQDGVRALTGGELREGAGGAGHDGALTGTELDVVHEGTYRNFAEREGVADLGRDALAGSDHGTAGHVVVFSFRIGDGKPRTYRPQASAPTVIPTIISQPADWVLTPVAF